MGISFTFKSFKSFKEATNFKQPSLVNLIIGRNNSGKSAFLEVLNYLYGNNDLYNPSIQKVTITCDSIDEYISSFYVSYFQNNQNAQNAFRKIISDNNFYFSYTRSKGTTHDPDQKIVKDINNFLKPYQYYYSRQVDWKSIINDICVKIGIRKFKIFKIDAERDIVPEKEDNNLVIGNKGDNLTNVLRYHTLERKGNKFLIRKIKESLNAILYGEEEFSDLKVQCEEKLYQITLTDNDIDIVLSEMGSGIKTILFVLYILYSIQASKEPVILMFEELENNLHPEIQRRLFDTIYEYAVENKTQVFITSHSHVAINCFYGKENTSLYHVFKKQQVSRIESIDSYLAKVEILDDLGVKASDIFQTNGVIWVEGPSDRIYIKKWLSILYPNLKENVHFSFLFYGGRLLSHYSTEEGKRAINILLENRNSAIVMDSDKKNRNSKINETKKRIKEEFEKRQLFCWITKGREIENYISAADLNRIHPEHNFHQVSQFESFIEYISSFNKNFANEKVKFSEEMSFNEESLKILDLKEQIIALGRNIQKWNNLDNG